MAVENPYPSPNFTVGRNGQVPEYIVVHIEQGTEPGTESWFTMKQSGVSARIDRKSVV